jgi:hypothetical protein
LAEAEIKRFLNETYVSSGDNDGYVTYDTSDFSKNTQFLLLGWDIYYGDGDCDVFIGFDNINIPQGSNIISATLSFFWTRIDNGYVETELHGNIDYNIPTDYSEFNAMTPTENFISLHQDDYADWQNAEYEVTNIVQELINRGDWQALNNIVFFSTNTQKETSDSGADIDSFESASYQKLTIKYEPPVEYTLEQILQDNRLEYYEYEKLSLSDGEYNHAGYLENNVRPGGDISINFDREIIGTCNLTVNDNADLNYLSDLIRVWYCTIYNEITYKFPLGTYMLLSPTRSSDGKVIERPIYGYDLTYALQQDKITTSVTYSAGTNVVTTIESILDSVGSWVIYNIPASSETLAEDASYELGKSKLFIVNSLLNKINYYPIWASGKGIFRSMPWSEIPNIIWNFNDDSKSLYASGILQRKDYADIYNKVVIIARQLTQDTEPLYKELTFEDIDLEDIDFSYTNISRYITKVFNSEATSQSYVDSRAERELRKMTEIEESINYKHALIFGRFNDGLPFNGDCFKFKNALLDLDYTYKIESMRITLSTGKLVNSMIRRVVTNA